MSDEELRQQFQNIHQNFQNLTLLIESVKTSLESEFNAKIGTLTERIGRMDVRLDKIAAGAHYVTRLAEWSEKQDHFQADLLHRVQVLEEKVSKLRP